MSEKSIQMRAHDLYVLQHGPSCADPSCDHPRCFIVRTLRREAYPNDPLNIAKEAPGSPSPGISQPAPRFVAVELLNESTTAEKVSYAEWVIIEVPVTYITKMSVVSYACTRALAQNRKYLTWSLGSVIWVRNELVLVPEQKLDLPT